MAKCNQLTSLPSEGLIWWRVDVGGRYGEVVDFMMMSASDRSTRVTWLKKHGDDMVDLVAFNLLLLSVRRLAAAAAAAAGDMLSSESPGSDVSLSISCSNLIIRCTVKAVWFSLTKTKTKMVKNEKITNLLTKTKTKTKKWWKLKRN